MYCSWNMFDDQVVVLKFGEPSSDSSVDRSWRFPVSEVRVVGQNSDWVFCGYEVGSPVCQGFDDCE